MLRQFKNIRLTMTGEHTPKYVHACEDQRFVWSAMLPLKECPHK